MVNDKLRAAAITELAEYMGIAAEFVVDDALAEVVKNGAFDKDPRLQNMFFFVCLGKLLPKDIPYADLKRMILKTAGISL